jgi:16S rRNA (cytidine1402-2'-O)-methyltransferase
MELVFGGERLALLARRSPRPSKPQGPAAGRAARLCRGDSNQQRGECVVLVAGWTAPEAEDAVSAEAMRVLDLLLGDALKRAAALAAEITGVRKNVLYQVALDKQKPNSSGVKPVLRLNMMALLFF